MRTRSTARRRSASRARAERRRRPIAANPGAHRYEFHRARRLVRECVGLEDLIQLMLQIARPAVLHFEQSHALSGELIAVEQGDQLQDRKSTRLNSSHL